MCGGGGSFNPLAMIGTAVGYYFGGPLGGMIGGQIGGALGGGSKSDSGASQPTVQAPVAPPAAQAAAVPEQNVFKQNLQGSGMGDPTALTGPTGVSNDELKLGKATVLGA